MRARGGGGPPPGPTRQRAPRCLRPARPPSGGAPLRTPPVTAAHAAAAAGTAVAPAAAARQPVHPHTPRARTWPVQCASPLSSFSTRSAQACAVRRAPPTARTSACPLPGTPGGPCSSPGGAGIQPPHPPHLVCQPRLDALRLARLLRLHLGVDGLLVRHRGAARGIAGHPSAPALGAKPGLPARSAEAGGAGVQRRRRERSGGGEGASER